MAYKTTYWANKALDLIFGAQAFTAPVTLYAALTTTVPTMTVAGTEVAYTGYARVAITNNLTNFPSAVAGAKANGTAITWPVLPAATGARTIVGVEFWDAASAGNRIGYGLPVSRTITDGDVYNVAAGQLVISET